MNNRSDHDIYLILDDLRSLLNVGAIFRTADAAGVKKIFLCGITAYPNTKLIRYIDGVDIEPITADENGQAKISYTPSKKCMDEFLQREIKKTALSGLNIDFEYCIDAADAIKKLKKEKVNIIALEQSNESVDYQKIIYKKPLAIVVGHERLGISNRVLNLCDQIADIPMHGIGKSLNVATATGIILYTARK